MKKLIVSVLLLSGLAFGYDYDDSDSGYKSDSGNSYQYDLNNPGDRTGYSVDTDAQQRDMYDSMYNNYDNHREQDQSNGQYGGGIYSK